MPVGGRRWRRMPVEDEVHRSIHARAAPFGAPRGDDGCANDPHRGEHRGCPLGEAAPGVGTTRRRCRRCGRAAAPVLSGGRGRATSRASRFRRDGGPLRRRGCWHLRRGHGSRRQHGCGCWGWRGRWGGCGWRRSEGGCGGRHGGATVGWRGRSNGCTAQPLRAVSVPPVGRRGEGLDTGGPHTDKGNSKEYHEERQEISLFSKLRKLVVPLTQRAS